MRLAQLDADVRGAIAASSLAHLPDPVLTELTAGAVRRHIAARSVIHQEIEGPPHLELVVAGLIRVHVSAPDGRTMTVRYCRPGALLGVATLYTRAPRRFGIQALTDAQTLSFLPAVVRAHADLDPRIARALLIETSERVLAFVAELSGQAFSTVPQRLARHLLDLASDHPTPDGLVASVNQQELADAAGTVREVVVRILRDLRDRRILETGRGGIRILDAEALFKIAAPDWNEGS